MKFKSFFIFALMVFALVLVVAPLAHGQTMYKWTDENGVVHFSDKKPPEVEAQQEALPTIQSSSGPNPYEGAATASSAAEQKRQQISQKSSEAQMRSQALSAQCNAWRSELSRIEPNRRVFYTNDQGETVRMDDVERTNKVAQLKQQISANCN